MPGSPIAASTSPARAVLIALAAHFLLYRVAFALGLLADAGEEALGLVGYPPRLAMFRMIRLASRDFLIAVALGLLVALVARAGRRLPRAAKLAGEALVVLALTTIGLAGAAHVRMMLELRSGLDLPALFESRVAMAGDVADFVSWRDWALAFSAPVAYLLLRIDRRRARFWSSLPVTVALAAVALFGVTRWNAKMMPTIVEHPVMTVVGQELSRPDLGLDRLRPLTPAPGGRFGFVDSALVSSLPGDGPGLCDGGRRPTSVMVVVVEAIAARHLEPDYSRFGEAMPFFRQLREEGWWLAEHRTSANSSAPAAFSLFTGLAAVPEIGLSVTSPRLSTPAMWSRLAMPDRFLITPAILSGYFPLGMVRHDGLREIRTYDELQQFAKRPQPRAALNELDGVDALVQRIAATAGRRFLGVYWSFAPHGPYFDADPQHAFVREPVDLRERHLNTLAIFDRQLRRIVDALRDAGHGDDTLLVVVADHGQAFGEHGAWGHGRSSWEEVLHVPALLWQPAAVPPRVDERLTSHADLLPTLLDLRGVAFDPLDFQGESLCRPVLRRRYLFSIGREGAVVSYDVATRRKLVWSYLNGDCGVYDLVADPGETAAQVCGESDSQLVATKRYFVSQRGLLRRFLGAPRDG